MNCPNCGNKIESATAKYCPECGHQLPTAKQNAQSFDYAAAVEKVKAGDSQAFQSLYEATYKDMYYLALKMMKNSAEAEDVLQDAYVKAWNSMNSLTDPAAFRSWLSRIVSNTAKNALVKKNPVLFSQLEGEDDDGEEYTFDIADDSKTSQPEVNYTEKETQDLVREMLGSLSEEQRICVLMFHLENHSIREIAETLGVSENTVKSRLNYGRKNLAKKADELQKKGYTLYGFAPLPLLLLLLHTEKTSAPVVQMASAAMKNGHGLLAAKLSASKSAAIHTVNTAAVKTVSTTGKTVAAVTTHAAKTAAKVSFFSTIGGKIAVAAVAVVVAGGAVGGTILVSRNANPTPSSAVVETQIPVEPTITPTEVPIETEVPVETEEPVETEVPVVEISTDELSNYISGNLTEYELETVLAYGPEEEQTGLEDYMAQGIMNEIVEAVDPDTGAARFETGMMGYEKTISIEEINRYFSSFSDYQFSSDNIAVVERGRYIAWAPATLNFAASANITSVTLDGEDLVIEYDYYYHKYSDDGDPDTIIDTKRQAVFHQLDDGMYRLYAVSDIEG